MTIAQKHYDLVIIGGGMVGSSLACMLAHASHSKGQQGVQPLKILIVESFPMPEPKGDTPSGYQPSFDARSTALSYGTRKIYQQFQLWDELAENVTAIDKIHVSDRGHWGASVMDSADENLPALGYIVENQWMGQVLLRRLKQYEGVEWRCPASAHRLLPKAEGIELDIEHHGEHQRVSADLAIVADGARSSICQQLGIGIDETAYGQSAIIANVSFTKSHQHIAYERFTEQGPMALLPLEDAKGQHRSALVWTLPAEQAQEWLDCTEQLFLEQLQQRFGYRVGRFTHVGRRFIYPLTLMQAKEQIRSGMVVMGNAAHALHPVAGQGYNLALRDVIVLSEILLAARQNEEAIGSLAVLQRYMDRQQLDQQLTVGFSDQLPKIFGIDQALIEIARGAGLVALDILPPAKKAFVQFATGLAAKESRI